MSGKDNIPFLDLVTPHVELEEELTGILKGALHTAGFIGGPMVEQFENAFAKFCDAKYCVGVGSGTDALRFALMAGGVRPGDVVITVPHTFIATTEAISQAGAEPRVVDIDERTYNIDPSKIGVLGGSAGAHLAALLGASQPGAPGSSGKPAAIAEWSGPTDGGHGLAARNRRAIQPDTH